MTLELKWDPEDNYWKLFEGEQLVGTFANVAVAYGFVFKVYKVRIETGYVKFVTS